MESLGELFIRLSPSLLPLSARGKAKPVILREKSNFRNSRPQPAKIPSAGLIPENNVGEAT